MIAWVNGRDSGNSRWFYIFTIALALGLTSSPLFYSALATLGVAWLGQRFVGPRFLLKMSSGNWKRTLCAMASWWAAAYFCSSAPFFLLNLGGLGAAASLFGDWLRQFWRRGQPGSSAYPLPGCRAL
ncbi:MAG: hypothetical protein M5U34_32580 [Chloroflexi bacterium]|nr:hypothetical protein [Chloroflexota bacterium]